MNVDLFLLWIVAVLLAVAVCCIVKAFLVVREPKPASDSDAMKRIQQSADEFKARHPELQDIISFISDAAEQLETLNVPMQERFTCIDRERWEQLLRHSILINLGAEVFSTAIVQGYVRMFGMVVFSRKWLRDHDVNANERMLIFNPEQPQLSPAWEWNTTITSRFEQTPEPKQEHEVVPATRAKRHIEL